MTYDILIMTLPWIFPLWIMLADLFGGENLLVGILHAHVRGGLIHGFMIAGGESGGHILIE